MLNRYLIGAVALIAYSTVLWLHGNHHGKQTAELATAHAWLDAAEQARHIEQAQQERINDVLRQQYQDQLVINASLVADLERLQHRPARTSLPETARPSCQGANGPELAREYAGFLARYAAAAAEQDAALAACYRYVDAITNDQ